MFVVTESSASVVESDLKAPADPLQSYRDTGDIRLGKVWSGLDDCCPSSWINRGCVEMGDSFKILNMGKSTIEYIVAGSVLFRTTTVQITVPYIRPCTCLLDSFCESHLAVLWSCSGFIMFLWWGANGAPFLCSPSCFVFLYTRALFDWYCIVAL